MSGKRPNLHLSQALAAAPPPAAYRLAGNLIVARPLSTAPRLRLQRRDMPEPHDALETHNHRRLRMSSAGKLKNHAATCVQRQFL